MTKEFERSAAQHDHALKELAKIDAVVEIRQTQLNATEQMCADKLEQCNKMEELLRELNLTREQASVQLEEMRTLQAEKQSELELCNSQVAAALQDLEKKKREVELTEKVVEELGLKRQCEEQLLHEQIEKTRNGVAQLHNQLDQQTSELTSLVTRAKDEVKKIESVFEIRGKLESHCNALENERQTLELEHANLRASNQQAEAQLDERKSEIGMVEKQLDALRLAKVELEAQIAVTSMKKNGLGKKPKDQRLTHQARSWQIAAILTMFNSLGVLSRNGRLIKRIPSLSTGRGRTWVVLLAAKKQLQVIMPRPKRGGQKRNYWQICSH